MRQKRRRRRKNGKQKLFCVILAVSSAILCGAAYGDSILIKENPENISRTGQNTTVTAEKIEKMEPKTVADVPANEEWNLILANPWSSLPEDFSVTLTQLQNGHAVDERAYPDLQDMMDDARAEGLSPVICSSFRTWEKQKSLYDNQVKQYLAKGNTQETAEAEAAKWVAIPGTGEHQTGLAVDIVSLDYQTLDEKQAETAEQKWLMENSYKYGFVLRYSKEKSEITGIHYEPWHYRYVGKEAAKEMFENNLCLEEYLQAKTSV